MMRPMLLSEAAQTLSGRLHGADARFESVSIDSRRLRARQLFFALRGERFDGHDFLAQAGERGAAGAVAERLPPPPLSCVQVDDSRRALAQLAAWNRAQFTRPLIAVTGSAGKTTCKEMIAAVLRIRGPTLATEANHNNEIGVPLTLLALRPEHGAAAVEMGAAGAGEIDFLAGLAQPDIAVITNALPAHLQGFGSLEGVARGKGEILDHLSARGAAVLNADDPATAAWAARCAGRRILLFGASERADCRVTQLRHSGGGAAFRLRIGGREWPVKLRLAGAHNALNAAAAVAAGSLLELEPQRMIEALESLPPAAGRLQRVREAAPAVIDDSYNASPETVRRAVDVLCSWPSPRLLVLGEMAELGEEALELHRRTGEYARAAGVDALLCCGALTRAAAEGFGAGAQHFSAQPPLLERLEQCAADFSAILIKGSRSARMERAVERVCERLREQEGAG